MLLIKLEIIEKKIYIVDDSGSSKCQIIGHHNLETFLFFELEIDLWEPKNGKEFFLREDFSFLEKS